MSELIPLATYNLAVEPYTMKASSVDQPYTIRLTLAAIDPESVDEKKTPTTLRILKRKFQVDDFSDDEEDLDLEDLEDLEDDEEDDDEEEAEESEEKKEEEGDEEDDDEEDDDEDDEDLDEDDDDMEEHVICTLSPESQYQQSLDITIMPEEEVVFVATGSYTIYLTGNYVAHPFDSDDEDEEDFEDDFDEDDYDLTPDEDEIIDGEDFDLDELEDVEDIESKIEELVESDLEKKESKKSNNKRAIEEEEETKKEEASPSKKSKKEKKEKTVQFKKELEQGPTPTKKEEPKPAKKEEKKKVPTKTLQGGVIVEDRTVGKGPVCKKGQKVGVRYVGKLKNGKVFDKNTSGKPFMFGLGKGEVIKGWDIGVAGMSVGGERRIVIPAQMAYGSQKLPGIPSNSELTFDVKLINIK
ncbi:hypothetical protein B5S32_g232 [[Candida] boidinii]|nr:hypothetical protein B5S29_g1560 [[Candida] boidinii]OWB76083.1 hypothetical protein B5S32_g232 [[Candida] boidinii]GME86487.1 unnamed protein product [[Candida] boidinii]